MQRNFIKELERRGQIAKGIIVFLEDLLADELAYCPMIEGLSGVRFLMWVILGCRE